MEMWKSHINHQSINTIVDFTTLPQPTGNVDNSSMISVIQFLFELPTFPHGYDDDANNQEKKNKGTKKNDFLLIFPL